MHAWTSGRFLESEARARIINSGSKGNYSVPAGTVLSTGAKNVRDIWREALPRPRTDVHSYPIIHLNVQKFLSILLNSCQ
jgi:hypothetical protein